MTQILLVTVGGSPEPILHSVRNNHADLVVFVVSDPAFGAASLEQVIGSGKPCCHYLIDGSIEQRPNLVSQLQLANFNSEQQLLKLSDPDDLGDCYHRIKSFCLQLYQQFSELKLIGDYSGGTKTMSAALVLALMELEAELTLVAGDRTNLLRIDQSYGVRSIPVGSLREVRLLQERLSSFLADHRYDRAAQALREYLSSRGDDLEDVNYRAGERLLGVLDSFVLWDRFQWQEALSHAEQVGLAETFPELHNWWQRVVTSRRWLDGNPPEIAVTGYELVQDLLLNADRRGRRGWYDDAIARLYRALELLAQTYTQLELKFDYRGTDKGLGLAGRYRWLKDFEGSTGLGGITSRQWHKIRPLLDTRNESLLGHGLKPVPCSTWQSLQDHIANLVVDTMDELEITPGPAPFQLPGKELLKLANLDLIFTTKL